MPAPPTIPLFHPSGHIPGPRTIPSRYIWSHPPPSTTAPPQNFSHIGPPSESPFHLKTAKPPPQTPGGSHFHDIPLKAAVPDPSQGSRILVLSAAHPPEIRTSSPPLPSSRSRFYPPISCSDLFHRQQFRPSSCCRNFLLHKI